MCIVGFFRKEDYFEYSFLLTHLWPVFLFYTSWKLQKIKSFLVVSAGMKLERRIEMG